MAISWDSFDKIWASTSPLTPYSFSDPNYAQGWNFIGSTPPARQMWDSIQKQNDEKFKYLRDNFGDYLPLAGGTMTGTISYSTDLASNRIGYDYDNRNGASMSLFNATSTTDTGVFKLIADDGTNRQFLEGKPNGELWWNDLSVALYKDSGYGYLVISDSANIHGVQICWGAAQNATSAGITVTFPKAFVTGSTVRVTMTSTTNSVTWVTDATTTNFKAHSVTTAWANYIAIANY